MVNHSTGRPPACSRNHSTLAANRAALSLRTSLVPRPTTHVPASRKPASSSACDGSVMKGQSPVAVDRRARRSSLVALGQPTMPDDRAPRPSVSPHCMTSESPIPKTSGEAAVHVVPSAGSAAATGATALRGRTRNASNATSTRVRRRRLERSTGDALSNSRSSWADESGWHELRRSSGRRVLRCPSPDRTGAVFLTRPRKRRNQECGVRFGTGGPRTSGGRGIRTHDGCDPIAVFKTAAIGL